MIDKADVIEFFDRCAPSWDAGLIRSDRKINIILDNAGADATVAAVKKAPAKKKPAAAEVPARKPGKPKAAAGWAEASRSTCSSGRPRR